MHRGKDIVMRLVLHVRQFVAEHPDVMVVNQRDCSHDGTDPALPKPFGSSSSRTRSRNASDRFVYPRLGDMLIELVQQVGIDRYTDTAQFCHAR